MAPRPDVIDRAPFAGANCVVTGGLGFIGSNLALELAAAGAEVTVIDSMVPTHGGNSQNLEGAARPITIVESDIADADVVPDAIAGAHFVFNLAGQVSHVDAMVDPTFDLDVNVRSHIHFLDNLRRVSPNAVVVHTSSRLVYGRVHSALVGEDHPCEPIDVNGLMKLAGERLHLIYAELHGLRASSLRITNTFGPRQRLLDNRQGVIPTFIRAARRGEALTIYGDGAQIRDCLYVDDVVAACLAAAVTPTAVGQVFNISPAEATSVRAIASEIVAAAGGGRITSVPWPRDRAQIEIGSYHGDASKAARVLGWRARVSLRDGLRRTFDFLGKHSDWYLSSI